MLRKFATTLTYTIYIHSQFVIAIVLLFVWWWYTAIARFAASFCKLKQFVANCCSDTCKNVMPAAAAQRDATKGNSSRK